jgi:hypothetical protein
MHRSLIALLAAFMLVALVPAAALAAKPTPSADAHYCNIWASGATWTVDAFLLFTGQPGGTTAVPFVTVEHYDGEEGSFYTFDPTIIYDVTQAKKNVDGGYGSATYLTHVSSPFGAALAAGDKVWLGVDFKAKNGKTRSSAMAMCTQTLP